MELEEVSQLLDVSKEQYDEILSIVQRHTDETVNWLGNMAAEFGWVAQAAGDGRTPQSIFQITMVRRDGGGRCLSQVVSVNTESIYSQQHTSRGNLLRCFK